jgi:hypothetical protein
MPKAKSKQTRLKYPATRRDDMRRLTEELKRDPMWVKNFVHRPPIRRRSTKNNSLILNRELEKSPIFVKNYLYRPSRSRKSDRKMKKPLGSKI